MASTHLTIDVMKWPEALFAMRVAMANMLRAEAEAESDPRLAKKLNALAATFETGANGEA
jgi:hypothetical protein